MTAGPSLHKARTSSKYPVNEFIKYLDTHLQKPYTLTMSEALYTLYIYSITIMLFMSMMMEMNKRARAVVRV